ncbi:metabotropic glutamate receptor [Elysia marginata]|uniref:Metabotropic glutamate receptor n=1 Tax=Elysia marginata TaxID=1093978 RepID=A0AAV4JLK0_9GAST|nr:metabotropic glutamate receptor [Elysia marginata]
MVGLYTSFPHLMIYSALLVISGECVSRNERESLNEEKPPFSYAVYDLAGAKESYHFKRENEVPISHARNFDSGVLKSHLIRHRHRSRPSPLRKHSSRSLKSSVSSEILNSTTQLPALNRRSKHLKKGVYGLHRTRKRSYEKEDPGGKKPELQDKEVVRESKNGGDTSSSFVSLTNTNNHAADRASDMLIDHRQNPSSAPSKESKYLIDRSNVSQPGPQYSMVSNLTKFSPKLFNFTWPVREAASVVEGQIVLGALHMIHERSHEYECGKVMEQGGIQALEAMLYTLDYVNGQGHAEQLIPGVRLGILAKDDCDTDILGLEQALDFIRGKFRF